MAKQRQNTKLESEGAEFLVLGQLLIHGVSAYKTYTNMPGYDIVAIAPDRNTSAKISVKSRWATNASGFIIKNFNCDFVVIAKLNRGIIRGNGKILPPEFFVIPAKVVKRASSNEGWGRIEFSKIPRFKSYADGWDLIRKFLYKRKKSKSLK